MYPAVCDRFFKKIFSDPEIYADRGTAPALFHFQHRMSYDIDIFVNDSQYFAFLSPKRFIEDSEFFQADYTELAHHISLTMINGIKADFLLAPVLTETWKP